LISFVAITGLPLRRLLVFIVTIHHEYIVVVASRSVEIKMIKTLNITQWNVHLSYFVAALGFLATSATGSGAGFGGAG